MKLLPEVCAGLSLEDFDFALAKERYEFKSVHLESRPLMNHAVDTLLLAPDRVR